MSNIKGPAMGYPEMLDFYITEAQVKAREAGKDFQKMPLRPSAAGQCARALAYQLEEFWGVARYDKPFKEPNVVRLLNLGSSIEYALIRDIKTYLKEHFQVKYEQQSLSFFQLTSDKDPSRNIFVEGSTDFALVSDKFKVVCDSKSKGDKFSSYRESKWKEDDEKFERMASVTVLGKSSYYADDIMAFLDEHVDPFMADNIIQINMYVCNPFFKERGFDHASLWYYNKNNSMLREFRFRPSQQLADYVEAKFKDVFTKVDSGRTEEVEREFNLGSIKCAFCDYKANCWPKDDALRTFFKEGLPAKEWPTDVHKLEGAELVEQLYAEYKQASEASDAVARLEEELCNALIAEKVRKVRFSDKEVYEVKFYKSPREHFELRRSKP